jgi:hypothetical protein
MNTARQRRSNWSQSEAQDCSVAASLRITWLAAGCPAVNSASLVVEPGFTTSILCSGKALF